MWGEEKKARAHTHKMEADVCLLQSDLGNDLCCFCHVLLATRADTGAVWEEITQVCEQQEMGSWGTIIELGYHRVHVPFIQIF